MTGPSFVFSSALTRQAAAQAGQDQAAVPQGAGSAPRLIVLLIGERPEEDVAFRDLPDREVCDEPLHILRRLDIAFAVDEVVEGLGRQEGFHHLGDGRTYRPPFDARREKVAEPLFAAGKTFVLIPETHADAAAVVLPGVTDFEAFLREMERRARVQRFSRQGSPVAATGRFALGSA